MTRPLVAVPTYPRIGRGRVQGWADEGVGLPARYIDALHRAGAQEAMFLPTAWREADAAALLRRVDGLLLIGGGDLDPATYGQSAETTAYGVDSDRDACELALARVAVELGVPTLAICRGHQVLATTLGGVLDQHITGRDGLLHHGVPGVDGGARHHEVIVEPASRLRAALGDSPVTVSSHHHQAVAQVGAAARLVATAPDGVIEGIELADPDGPWVVGVQWHPEDTAVEDAAQQRLFDTFVAECRATGAGHR